MNTLRAKKTAADKNGFVPVELLAILVLLILLTGIILPAATNLKHRSTSLRCINNHRQIVQAWTLYAQENNGQCANNFTIPETERAIVTATFDNWTNTVMTWSANNQAQDRSVTNEIWAATGTLQPYTDGDILIYKCPADNFLAPVQRARGYTRRLRTTSMNAFLGRLTTQPGIPDRNPLFPAYRQWLKVRSIPQPARTFVTIDEHPDSMNDGVFINDPNGSTWADMPASLHAGAGTLSFVDGHTESHPWLSSRTKIPVVFVYSGGRPLDAAGRRDFAWVRDRTGLVR